MSSNHARRQRMLWKEARRNGSVVECGICGEPITRSGKKGGITVDHIMPLSVGGKDTIKNMQPAHNLCNGVKANMFGYKKKVILGMINRALALKLAPRKENKV